MGASALSALHLPEASVSITPSWLQRAGASRLRVVSGRRRVLTSALGLIWLLDAALQCQPYMFTRAFPQQVIAPTATGNPGWVHDPVVWASGLMAHHIVLLNAVFALAQLLIAVGLLWPRTTRPALAGSVVWSLLVWWLGEGLGGILAGPVSPFAGLPGAVVLYAVIAVLIWPRALDQPEGRPGRSVAKRSLLGERGASTVWMVLWLGFAVETLWSANSAPAALHDLVAGAAEGEPGWIRTLNTWAAGVLAGRGLMISIVLAACLLLIGLSVLVPSLTRAGVVLAIVFSLGIWVIAEDFGTIATGRATDPNSGLPLVLLALCYWPSSRQGDQSISRAATNHRT